MLSEAIRILFQAFSGYAQAHIGSHIIESYYFVVSMTVCSFAPC